MAILPHLVYLCYVSAAASTFALLEVQIEGPNGWAAHLPTWRVANRWTKLFLGSRPLTGYFAFVHLFFLLLLHLSFGLGLLQWSMKIEARILSFGIFFWILEDFLWFIFNPAFGIRKFRREYIPWHMESWWGFMPREYWVFLPIGLALYLWSWNILAFTRIF